MEPETYQRLQSIVLQAAALPPERRTAFLSRECAGDDALLAEAKLLLPMMAEGAGAYSERAVGARRSELESIYDGAQEAEEADAWVPERIGSYSVRRVIGRGGSGVVFEAEQDRPQRTVALKLLHPALATPETIKRISKEADALARLQHPGVAQVFEVGTFDLGTGEQPFFAMELVDGFDLARHAHHAELGTRERVELLARVCDAVGHAHERGVVHRDLKPDNILVDASGQPKLLDFGIARIARDASLSMEALTAEGQLLGTAAYMAPEQAGASRSSALDAPAIDVFALGALGFELFVERRPRQLDGLSMTQMMNEVASAEIPRLRTVDPGIAVDLETIVGKACDTEPTRRYASAAALGADLRRWLESRPIAARPPTAVYRARKFVRRHRTLALGAGTTIVSLAVGLAVSIMLAARARSAADETQRKLYAAEMLVATGASMEPATRIRSAALTAHWTDAPELLGWEWHLLDAVRRRDVVALDLPGYPLGLDWHPDGDRVVVAMETSVGVFDPATGAALDLHSFASSLPDCHITGARWSADGSRVAVSAEHRVFLWIPGSDDVLWEHEAEFAPDVCWHPDGERVFYVGHTVVGLDADTGAVVFHGEPKPWGISGDLFDARGDRLAFARGMDQAVVFSFPSLEPALTLARVQLPVLSRVDWSPDSTRLAATGTDHTVRVIDTATGDILFTNREHRETVFGADWHPTLPLLAVSAEDGTVRILDASSGSTLETYLRHETKAFDVQWSPDGAQLGTVAVDGEALIWSTEEQSAFRGYEYARLAADTTDCRLQWEPVGGTLLASRRGTGARLRPGAQGRLEPAEYGGRVSLSLDRSWYAASRGAEHFTIAHRATGAVVHEANMGDDSFLMHDWVPGQDVVLAGSRHGLFRFDVDASGAVQERRLCDVAGQVQHLRNSPDGTRCAFVHASLQVQIVDAATGATVAEVGALGRVGHRALCWSPAGERVALAGSDGALRVASAVTGRVETTMLGHTNQVEGVHWHPDGRRIATGGRDRTVKLWDPATGDLTANLPCRAAIADVQWIQDGAVLAALDVDGRIYVWDASRSLMERR